MKNNMLPCPNCGFFPLLRKRKKKYFYECNGDCWTRTSYYYDADRALKAWNELSEKKEGNSDGKL